MNNGVIITVVIAVVLILVIFLVMSNSGKQDLPTQMTELPPQQDTSTLGGIAGLIAALGGTGWFNGGGNGGYQPSSGGYDGYGDVFGS